MKSMKVFAAMFCAAMVFAFVGCSKKDLTKDILGSWKATTIIHSETYQGQSRTMTEEPEGDCRITFNEDRTFKATTNGKVDGTGAWYIVDGKLLMTSVGIVMHLGVEPVTVDIDGNDMTLTKSETRNYVEMTVTLKFKKV